MVHGETHGDFNAPSLEQLRQLARLSVVSATRRDRLIAHPRFPASRYFIDTVAEDMEETVYAGQHVGTYHRIAGRVGRVVRTEDRAKLREWSLKIFDLHAVRHSRGWLNAQALYRFHWDEEQTLVSERRLNVIAGNDQKASELDSAVENLYIPEEFVAMWSMGLSALPVSGTEFGELAERMREYLGVLERRNEQGLGMVLAGPTALVNIAS